MTVTGFIAFAQGWGGLYIRANKLAYEQIKRHPGLGIPNRLGIPDVPERVHWEHDLATEVGTPGAYDDGPERCSWLTSHLTNWMGDDGFLVRHRCEIRHHNVVGDWLRIDARVTATFIDATGRALVTVEQEARNQDGELSARATGTISLPRRDQSDGWVEVGQPSTRARKAIVAAVISSWAATFATRSGPSPGS
jgi:hypothetical protein